MKPKLKIILNLVLTILLFYAIYLILEIPQPYGIIALGSLIVTFLFNGIKKKIISIPLYIVGLGSTIFVLFSAYTFTSYTNKQRSKFDIPTAVIFENTNFKTSLDKAKSEDKPIFVDFYTSWCTPCLSFTKDVLTDDEVGKYMNEAFINLKYDAEKGEGITIAKRYNVKSYPTLLILDNNGDILENVMGSLVANKNDMIRISKKYLNQNIED